MAVRGISWRRHVSKNGRVTHYARFRQAERGKGGKIVYRPVERSVGACGKREGAQLVAEWQEEALKRAQAEAKSVPTFADVALTYMRTKGPTPYMTPILNAIGLRLVTDIDQGLVASLAAEIYPGRTPATINRQIYTPIIAALRMSAGPHSYAMPNLTRPKGHDSLPELDIPSPDWYRKVLPVANPWLRAFLVCGRLHGRRPGEYLSRTRDHFDANERTLAITDTKTNKKLTLQLAQPAWASIMAIPDVSHALRIETSRDGAKSMKLTGDKRTALFGTFQRTTMRKWLIEACEHAGVRYHMPKEAGRHACSTGHLADGKTLKWVKEAMGWSTIKMPAEKYGHLEKTEVAREARIGGENWFSNAVGELPSISHVKINSGEPHGDGD